MPHIQHLHVPSSLFWFHFLLTWLYWHTCSCSPCGCYQRAICKLLGLATRLSAFWSASPPQHCPYLTVPGLQQILRDTGLLYVWLCVSTGLRDTGGSYLTLQGSLYKWASSHRDGGRDVYLASAAYNGLCLALEQLMLAERLDEQLLIKCTDLHLVKSLLLSINTECNLNAISWQSLWLWTPFWLTRPLGTSYCVFVFPLSVLPFCTSFFLSIETSAFTNLIGRIRNLIWMHTNITCFYFLINMNLLWALSCTIINNSPSRFSIVMGFYLVYFYILNCSKSIFSL